MSRNDRLVSILIPTFNRTGFFEEALKSAIQQTYKDIEIIVSDDGTDDATEALMGAYTRKHDNIRYVRNRPGWGAAINFQKCLKMAQGAYVNFLMDDDLLHPMKVERMLDMFDANPTLSMVTSSRVSIDAEGKQGESIVGLDSFFPRDGVFRGADIANTCLRNVANLIGEPTTVLFRSDALDEPFGVLAGRHYGCNVDMASWGVLLNKGDLGFLRQPLSFLRVHAGQQSHELRMHLKGIADWAHQIDTAHRFGLLQRHDDFVAAAARITQMFSHQLGWIARENAVGFIEEIGLFDSLRSIEHQFRERFRVSSSAVQTIDPAPVSAPANEPAPGSRCLHQGAVGRAATAVLLHLHYPELVPELVEDLRRLEDIDLYVSLSPTASSAASAIAAAFPSAHVIETVNRGRDILPRLRLGKLARQGSHRQWLMLHGKRSPHLSELRQVTLPFLQHRDGDRWRRDLLDTLIGKQQQVLDLLRDKPEIGLVGPAGFWLRLEGDPNWPRVAGLAQRMGLAGDPSRHGYFAGSMFWCRPEALDPLLRCGLRDEDFEVEAGQLDATTAHAVERAFCLSADRAGFAVADTLGVVVQGPAPLLPWLPARRLLPGERQWADASVAGWQDVAEAPRLRLAVLHNGAQSAAATLESLRMQWFAGQIVQVPADPSGERLLGQVNSLLCADDADWVGMIDAGDRIAEDALFRVAHAIHRNPHWQVVYTDEDSLSAEAQHLNPHFKPDFNLDYLRSLPYVGGLLLIRRDLFEALGGFDPEREGAEDYDFLLRAWEHLQLSGAGEGAIGHVPELLYHRAHGSGHSRKSVPELLAAGQRALQAHFDRLGIPAEVQGGPFPPAYRVRWPLPETRPLVSIIIPTRDQLPMLQRCVESLIEKTRYPAYEVLIVDNDSRADDAVRYLDMIEARESELGGRMRVIRAPGEFNFSAMNNAAARAARGEYLLLLNNDTAVLHEEWLDEMIGHAVRPDVGAVGAKLLFPDGKIQHAGVILGVRGPAEHPFLGRAPEDRGYFGRAQLVQDLSAVTGACLLVRRNVYEQVGGLDEQAFKVSYNDIDLCLKIRAAGLRVVFTPFALLMHEGSASQRGQVEAKPDEAKQKRFAGERLAMYDKWLPVIARDPAYNRHLSLASTEFLIDDQLCVAWDPEWRPRPRLLAHAADREGCGEYRIIAPMRSLVRAGRVQGWETMRLFDPAEMERISPDSLVVQRQMEWPQIEALERHGRYCGAFRVFEIDDLITNLPVKSVHRAHIHKDIAKRFRKAAGLCHRLVVATEPLAKAYAGFSDEVVVCPNYVERARWGELRPARAERKRLRVGWAGGVGHSGDLELIVDVVRQTAQQVDWVFFGLCPPELRDVVREFHPGVPLDQYAPKLAALDLDLAVAPLEHNAFNEAKSHLRLLEYGVLGYPVICSDITPYQGDFPVVRVANRFRDWVRAIQDAVSDPQALRAQGDALRAKVYENWMLEDHLDTWMRAWTR